jgi:PAS domain S-box-containing protein
MAALTGAVAALLVGALLVTIDHVRLRAMAIEGIITQAEITATQVTAHLRFDLPDEALEVLETLHAIDHLGAAWILNAADELFAGYQPAEQGVASTRPALAANTARLRSHQFVDGSLFVTEPIRHDEDFLGTLIIAYDFGWMTSRLWGHIGLSVLVALAAMSAAMVVAMFLHRSLAGPVQELALTARLVSRSGDFSIRARRLGEDELGELTNVFNDMLAQIERQAEEIRHANDRFRVAVEAAPNAMVMVDEDGRIVLVNEKTEELFGYVRNELLGRTVELLVPPRFRAEHPGHRTGFFARPAAREMGAGRDLFGLRKDKSEFPVEIGLNPIPTEGGLRVLSSIVDITERKRAEDALRGSEERLRTMMNAAPAIIWTADADGSITGFNEQWYEYTACTDAQSLGSGWAASIHPDDRDRCNDAWQYAVKAGEEYTAEFRLRNHNNRYRWFMARAVPLRDADGTITGWFGTTTDIQDRKQAEEERARLLESERAARSEAERASRMKDEFVATLSHELRTPLTAILGWAQMLRRRGVSTDHPQVMQGLEIIERNARVQTQLIEDLLDMSRIISGKVRLDVQRVDLPDVIDAAVATIEPAASAKEIRLQKVVDPRVGSVHGDPGRLQQVVWNLLSNAVKFTPKGGRVQVALQRINSHIEINVSDTGEGIKPEFLPHLFERFRQADASTTRRYGGLGLGLAIVKQLVELHGGDVRAHSAGEGRGATFTVQLPLAIMRPIDENEERLHPRALTPLTEQIPGVGPTSLEGVRVLVVEDEPDARDLICRLLEHRDALVLCTSSADEALDAVEDFHPDVLVSDIGMPVKDGYELIRELRSRGAEHGGTTPAIALTAFARTEDRTRALLAGYQMHVAKPVEPAELVASVASMARLTHRRVNGDGERRRGSDA